MPSNDRNEEVDNLTILNSLTDPNGTAHTGELADISDTGGGSSNIYGTFGETLSGSSDLTSPTTGLATAIENAISSGKYFIRITGCWSMDGEVTFNSRGGTTEWTLSNGENVRLPIYIDARGAFIEYAGNGWAITNAAHPSNGGSLIDGGYLVIDGGYWIATGSPSGWLRAMDTGRSWITPDQLFDWSTDGSTDTIRIEAVETWCEDNYIGGFKSYMCDTTIAFVDNWTGQNNVSFQDNTIVDVKCGRVKNGAAAVDINGNFIDCTIRHLSVITGSEGAAAIRHNANMSGTEIYRLEIEQASGGYTNCYKVRIGSDARSGPVERGGQDFSDSTRFDIITETEPGGWSWFWDTSGGENTVTGRFRRYRFAGSGQIFMTEHGGGGFIVYNLSDVNDTNPSSTISILPSGDISIDGEITTVNGTY